MNTLSPHYKIEFGFGIGLDADGEKMLPEKILAGIQSVRMKACTLFGGCTLLNTLGDWRDPETGKVYSEPGRTLVVYLEGELPMTLHEHLKVNEMAGYIKGALDQKAVYVVVTNCIGGLL